MAKYYYVNNVDGQDDLYRVNIAIVEGVGLSKRHHTKTYLSGKDCKYLFDKKGRLDIDDNDDRLFGHLARDYDDRDMSLNLMTTCKFRINRGMFDIDIRNGQHVDLLKPVGDKVVSIFGGDSGYINLCLSTGKLLKAFVLGAPDCGSDDVYCGVFLEDVRFEMGSNLTTFPAYHTTFLLPQSYFMA